MQISIDEWTTNINTVWFFAGCAILIWAIGGVGYSIAKTKKGRLNFGKVYQDDVHGAIRLGVCYCGAGEVEPKVFIEGFVDENGKPFAEHLGDDMPLHWKDRRAHETVKLSEDGLPKADVTVLWLRDFNQYGIPISDIVIYNESNHISLLSLNAGSLPQKIGIKMKAIAPKCLSVTGTFWIERNVSNKLGYSLAQSHLTTNSVS